MTTQQTWLKTCPLCGGENQCAMASGDDGRACWCQAVIIDAAALARIPADSVGKRCLCPACGQTSGDTSDAR
tara:strand:+ start:325858 stop:326073 length:216 start_codon:yes stop_codon:yes gene_type:complete